MSKPPGRRLDVLHSQIDFGLPAMMSHMRERIPERLAREHQLASESVKLLIQLLRRHGVKFFGALVKGVGEKLDCGRPVGRSGLSV